MATFDDLRASRDKLAKRVEQIEQWLFKAHVLLAEANSRFASEWAIKPQIALLLQELNRELKRDNDEVETR